MWPAIGSRSGVFAPDRPQPNESPPIPSLLPSSTSRRPVPEAGLAQQRARLGSLFPLSQVALAAAAPAVESRQAGAATAARSCRHRFHLASRRCSPYLRCRASNSLVFLPAIAAASPLCCCVSPGRSFPPPLSSLSPPGAPPSWPSGDTGILSF